MCWVLSGVGESRSLKSLSLPRWVYGRRGGGLGLRVLLLLWRLDLGGVLEVLRDLASRRGLGCLGDISG